MKVINLKVRIYFTMFAAIFALVFLNGCSEDSVTPAIQVENLEFSNLSTSDSVDTGILTIEWVKLLVKDIKLQAANSSEDSVSFKTGPYMLYLNLASNLTNISSAYIAPGTYNKIMFMVHKLQDNEQIPDPDFADSLGRYSVIVKGRYAGADFIYKSSKSAHQKITSPNSLVVNISGKSNINISAQPYIWFIKNGVYLDPGIPSNTNDIDNNIKNNINNSFKVFLDNDKNGLPD